MSKELLKTLMSGIHTLAFLLVAFVIVVTLLFAYLKFRHKLKNRQKQQASLRKMLEDAQLQNNIFEINLQNQEIRYHTISCLLGKIGSETLELEALNLLPSELCHEAVEIFYRIYSKEGVTIRKFRSVIREVRNFERQTVLVVQFPDEIGSGERRLFHRIEPPKDRVRVIAFWALNPDLPLPKETNELGSPLLQYRHGVDKETIQVSDVSASGMAVQIATSVLGGMEQAFQKDARLLTLLVYCHAPDRPLVIYWSTCKICNVRNQETPEPALILGMEFTNWALLERGKSEIHWLATRQAAGISPMSQWVMQMDRDQQHLST